MTRNSIDGNTSSTTTSKSSASLTLSNDKMFIRDWRKALQSPPSYHRIGNRKFRFNYQFGLLIVCVITLILIYLYFKPLTIQTNLMQFQQQNYANNWMIKSLMNPNYNYTYPLSQPIIVSSNGLITYRIGMVADMDTNSLDKNVPNQWISYLKKGFITYNSKMLSSNDHNSIVVSFETDEKSLIRLTSTFAHKGRGMELSELITFNGHILTFDDRTGIIYSLQNDKVIPWLLLIDGDGNSTKGFKSEWATVKDQVLYVGSMGKEWTTSTGEFESIHPMYVKAITMTGEVYHLNWIENYKAIRSSIGITWPGYMIHESGMWSLIHRKWFFLPRRCSKDQYNETKDEHMGCNVLISAEEDFSKIRVIKLGEYKSSQGFSSFKFLPNSNDNIIVALQSEEVDGKTSTYITAFTIDGNILLKSEKIDTDLKYEGIEFL